MPGWAFPPHVVLDASEVDGEVVRLVAWRDQEGVLWIGLDGPTPFHGGIGCHTGTSDDAVESTSTSSASTTVCWGYVRPDVSRCEIVSATGERTPATIVSLPRDLSGVDRAVWGTTAGSDPRVPWGPTLIGLDDAGRVISRRPYLLGPAETVASGTHPEFGPWGASISPMSFGLELTVMLERHGGGGSGLRPIEGGILGGLCWSSGGVVDSIDGTAAPHVRRVAYVLDDGPTLDAELVDLPERYVGPLRLHVGFVPGGGRVSGDVVAYDAAGNELERRGFGRDDGGPPDGTGGARSDGVRS